MFGYNIDKVSQSIENVSHSIKIMNTNINNANVVSKDSKKISLKYTRIKCFEKIRCEIVINREVFKKKTKRR